MRDRLSVLEDRLGHSFRRIELLEQALIHVSAARTRSQSNERLEFLGDRVLGLAIARLLFERFPDEDEGLLARRHGVLVGRDCLARVAENLDLATFMVLSSAEREPGGRTNPGLIADACEAVIAALHLDGGMAVAEAFVRRHWEVMVDADGMPPKDSKTALQEWAQGRGLPLPEYREVGREGPAHAPLFTLEVEVAGMGQAAGSGPSKRVAAQAAAQALLERLAKGTESPAS